MTSVQKQHRCGRVALMGPPNAGKSTLLNALVGQKVSIVTSRPQTTRGRIVGILSEKDAQIIFLDTPGVNHNHRPMRGHLGKMMSQAAWESMAAAESVLLVLDAALYLRHPEFLDRDIKPLLDALKDDERPVVVAVNKVDLFHDKTRMLPLLETLQAHLPRADIFPLSAAQKDGIAELRALLADRLPVAAAVFPEDQLSTAPVRFLAAEIVREKVFERLRQEVPYSTAVAVESWEEDQVRGQTVIHAVIFVSRPSHKAMVIGRGGATIKEIGTAARRDIKELVGGKVHLELWVKVRENWTEDVELLHEMGLGGDDQP